MNDKSCACRYLKGVIDCEDVTKCSTCGWNPDNDELRKARVKAVTSGAKKPKTKKRKLSQGIKVYCIEKDMYFESVRQASMILNAAESAIRRCLQGEQKTCKGMHFIYGE